MNFDVNFTFHLFPANVRHKEQNATNSIILVEKVVSAHFSQIVMVMFWNLLMIVETLSNMGGGSHSANSCKFFPIPSPPPKIGIARYWQNNWKKWKREIKLLNSEHIFMPILIRFSSKNPLKSAMFYHLELIFDNA